jgi:hypothetical protein
VCLCSRKQPAGRHGAVYILSCSSLTMPPDTRSPALVLGPKSADCRELHRPDTSQGFSSVGCSLPPADLSVPAACHCTRPIPPYAQQPLFCLSVSRGHPVAQPDNKGLHHAHRDAMSSRTSVPAPERVRKRVAEACAFCRRRKVRSTPPAIHPRLTSADQVQRGKALVRGMQDIQQDLQLRGRP